MVTLKRSLKLNAIELRSFILGQLAFPAPNVASIQVRPRRGPPVSIIKRLEGVYDGAESLDSFGKLQDPIVRFVLDVRRTLISDFRQRLQRVEHLTLA